MRIYTGLFPDLCAWMPPALPPRSAVLTWRYCVETGLPLTVPEAEALVAHRNGDGDVTVVMAPAVTREMVTTVVHAVADRLRPRAFAAVSALVPVQVDTAAMLLVHAARDMTVTPGEAADLRHLWLALYRPGSGPGQVMDGIPATTTPNAMEWIATARVLVEHLADIDPDGDTRRRLMLASHQFSATVQSIMDSAREFETPLPPECDAMLRSLAIGIDLPVVLA